MINYLLTGEASAAWAAWMLAVKFVIWTIALGSMTSGGILAPILTMVCCFAHCWRCTDK